MDIPMLLGQDWNVIPWLMYIPWNATLHLRWAG